MLRLDLTIVYYRLRPQLFPVDLHFRRCQQENRPGRQIRSGHKKRDQWDFGNAYFPVAGPSFKDRKRHQSWVDTPECSYMHLHLCWSKGQCPKDQHFRPRWPVGHMGYQHIDSLDARIENLNKKAIRKKLWKQYLQINKTKFNSLLLSWWFFIHQIIKWCKCTKG